MLICENNLLFFSISCIMILIRGNFAVNHQQIADLSAELIIRYYENDYLPFLQNMDDDALWYGPAEGQFLCGRERMLAVWQAEEHPLRFTMGNLTVAHAATHSSFCNVMLSYSVVTHYPDGHDVSVYQRTLLCWGDRKSTEEDGNILHTPRILVCHIANLHAKHEDDVVYPKSSSRGYALSAAMPQRGERIHFHGADRSDYFYLSDSIYWIESAAAGKHSVLHTSTADVEVMTPVSQIGKKYPKLFLRCHQSCLINPHYLRNIRRFQVTLTDGTTLPIPEKKYTAFREKAMAAMKA